MFDMVLGRQRILQMRSTYPVYNSDKLTLTHTLTHALANTLNDTLTYTSTCRARIR